MKHSVKLDFSLTGYLKVDLLRGKSERGYVALIQNIVVNLKQKTFLRNVDGS